MREDGTIFVAFVGITRPPSSLPTGYWNNFVRYHLELPFYYGRHPKIKVQLVTSEDVSELSTPEVEYIDKQQFINEEYDVVIHWRSWQDGFFRPDERHIMLSQDHSFSGDWLKKTKKAIDDGQLDGILVFPGWHKNRVYTELNGKLPMERLYSGLSFGVDTEIYYPDKKNPKMMLWASDPGRGLDKLIPIFMEMWSQDPSLKLTVVHPDYVQSQSLVHLSSFFKHPGVIYKGNIGNGPELWDLFRKATFFPYSSTFPEPSSRCHRQAQAAGCIVLYPPCMGTPSEMIVDGLTGIVAPIDDWPDVILSLDDINISWISSSARNFALEETWDVQASRFYDFFKEKNFHG